jgi:hypothetical protein
MAGISAAVSVLALAGIGHNLTILSKRCTMPRCATLPSSSIGIPLVAVRGMFPSARTKMENPTPLRWVPTGSKALENQAGLRIPSGLW